jgi:hypothetical protein
MRALDPDIIKALEADHFTFFFLLKLDFDSPLYLTDGDNEFYYEGNTYAPVGFKFSSIQGNSGLAVDSFDIDVDDTNQGISSVLLSEDVRNRWGQVLLAIITETDVDDGGVPRVQTDRVVASLFRGIVGGWDLTGDNMARITLTNEMVLWNKEPLRIQSTSCPWSYKGVECGYTGAEEVCDKSYEACQQRNNEANFGGDRFLAATMTKSVWWGRTRNYQGK